MKITVLLPEFEDPKIKDCLNEIIRQENAALADIYKKIDELKKGVK